MTANPFHPTDAERREGYTLMAQFAASLVLGPIGPFAVFAARYLYDRRDALFDPSGRPVRAFDVSGTPVRPDLGGNVVTVRPNLTASAQASGLRQGDPVGLVLTGQQNHNGLIVPARLGEPVDIAVPRGTYALGAFAARRDQLFTRAHPFTAVDGRTVTWGAGRALDLAPRSRPTLLTPTAATWATPVRRTTTPKPLRTQFRPPEPTCWWCDYPESTCDCLIGEARRFWRG
ncbi:hypothetical protein ABZ816_37435 [Actinosynnema sp. NPDC047251]|uniref:Putative membrane protein n=1 Tax=Saccharothrix espanaensis (strain ATCC 51144 / DSM 44229 / JCM 9112 / NBRC 15066 / NRRL 15764) TaxID=1179773 RepID=K0KCX8_SACES|nr:hypothetical protein [Saccharothrix espanaensis]CCH34438.1 putative membrane protein [Saccharothrix espanaensis DSM 44229]